MIALTLYNDKIVVESAGFEKQASINLLMVHSLVTEHQALWRLISELKISSTTFKREISTGIVRRHTSRGLAEIFDLNEDYFNGKLQLKENSNECAKITSTARKLRKNYYTQESDNRKKFML